MENSSESSVADDYLHIEPKHVHQPITSFKSTPRKPPDVNELQKLKIVRRKRRETTNLDLNKVNHAELIETSLFSGRE